MNQTFGGGRSGIQMAPAYGAAFGGIDNDQPEIKARQRHRARLDPKPRYPSKDFHHKEFAKKLRDGFRGLREKRKELNHNFKGNTEGNSYVSRRPLLQVQRRISAPAGSPVEGSGSVSGF